MNNKFEEQIISNQGLVYHVINSKNYPDEYLDDLYSVGNIGLIKAVKQYTTDKGYAFSTYAVKCIRNEINMYLRKEILYKRKMASVVSVKSLYNSISDMETKIMIRQCVDSLDEHDKDIIYKRFGLDNNEILSQSTLANMLNTTQSHISKLENRIINDIRNTMFR